MEKLIRTVVFTDIVGSVRLYGALTDAAAAEVLASLERRVREIVPPLGGTFIKATGEGHLLSFEDSHGAVQCARRIHAILHVEAVARKQALSARIAGHRGELLSEHGDIHGNTVNLAARALAVASPGETVLTAEAWKALPSAETGAFRPHGPEVFKGFTTVCRLYREPRKEPLANAPLSTEREDTTFESAGRLPRHSQYLLELEHPNVRKAIRIRDGEIHLIGRGSECHTPIPDRAFSSTHAAFAVEEGLLWAFDLGSTNGLTLGEHRIHRRRPVPPDSLLRLPTGTIRARPE